MNPTSKQLDLAADVYNRYPGECVTFFIRFTAPNIPAAQLQIELPRSLKVESYLLPQGIPVSLLSVTEVGQDLIALLPLHQHFTIDEEYEITLKARIHPYYFDHYLEVDASLLDQDLTVISTESIQIAIFGRGKYLDFLPELYGSDDFTSRFLMLFESFWKPVSQQIDQIENYFDPDVTPEDFIPWLCSWVGLPVDKDLPIERMRKLLKNALYLYQCRGTMHALKTMLEIYSGGTVTITEQRAKNFVLGAGTTLGPTVAIGKENKPDSVQVKLNIPSSELARMQFTDEMYKRKISGIIQDLIPAHSALDVKCDFTSERNKRSSL